MRASMPRSLSVYASVFTDTFNLVIYEDHRWQMYCLYLWASINGESVFNRELAQRRGSSVPCKYLVLACDRIYVVLQTTAT